MSLEERDAFLPGKRVDYPLYNGELSLPVDGVILLEAGADLVRNGGLALIANSVPLWPV